MSERATNPSNPTQNHADSLPWLEPQVLHELSCGEVCATPKLHTKVGDNISMSAYDSNWTCYRKNYISVDCRFELQLGPIIPEGLLTITHSGARERVVATGIRISAMSDENFSKHIDLVQFTSSREKAATSASDVIKVAPTVSQSTDMTASECLWSKLPFQSVLGSPPTSGTPGCPTRHRFERLQFKRSTRNKSRSRKAQEYFRLVIEMFVDIRRYQHDDPRWIKLIDRKSERIVVRGRSPGSRRSKAHKGANGISGTQVPQAAHTIVNASPSGSNNYRTADDLGYVRNSKDAVDPLESVSHVASAQTDFLISRSARIASQQYDCYRPCSSATDENATYWIAGWDSYGSSNVTTGNFLQEPYRAKQLTIEGVDGHGQHTSSNAGILQDINDYGPDCFGL